MGCLQAAGWDGDYQRCSRSASLPGIQCCCRCFCACAAAALQEDSSAKRLPSDPLIPLTHDPLVLAAIGGHLEAVKALEGTELLCPPCAAAQAAKSNRTDVVQHLALGTAKVMMQVCAPVCVAGSFEVHGLWHQG